MTGGPMYFFSKDVQQSPREYFDAKKYYQVVYVLTIAGVFH